MFKVEVSDSGKNVPNKIFTVTHIDNTTSYLPEDIKSSNGRVVHFISKIVVSSIIPSGLAAMYGSSTHTTIPDLLAFRLVTLSNQARATG